MGYRPSIYVDGELMIEFGKFYGYANMNNLKSIKWLEEHSKIDEDEYNTLCNGWDEVKMSLQVSQCKKKTHYGGYKGVTHTMETCHINYTYTYRGESHSGSMTGERPSSGKVKAYINPKAPGAPKIYKPVIPLVCVFSFISILCFILAICFRPGSKDENINRPPRRQGMV